MRYHPQASLHTCQQSSTSRHLVNSVLNSAGMCHHLDAARDALSVCAECCTYEGTMETRGEERCFSRIQEPRKWLFTALWAVGLTLVAAGIGASERIQLIGFCSPAAHMAAFATGMPCTGEPDGYRLSGQGLDLTVVPACAAVDFFCLLTAFLSMLFSRRAWSSTSQLAVLPVAWLITIATNSIRIASCWQTDRWAHSALPPSLWPGLHLGVGVATFLVALTIVFWVVTRIDRRTDSRHSGGYND